MKHILVAVFPVDGAPELRAIAPTLEAKQAIVQGRIETFPVPIEGTIGLCNEEGLFGHHFNIYSPVFRQHLCAPFLVVGDDGENFLALTLKQIAALDTNRERFGLLDQLRRAPFLADFARSD